MELEISPSPVVLSHQSSSLCCLFVFSPLQAPELAGAHPSHCYPTSPPSQSPSRAFCLLVDPCCPQGRRDSWTQPRALSSTEISTCKGRGLRQSPQGTSRVLNWDGLGDLGRALEPLELGKFLMLENAFSPLPPPAQLSPLFISLLPQLIQGKPS